MTINKNDFIELDFTGTSNGQIFDTTRPDEAKTLGLKPESVSSTIICVGNDMLLKGLDEFIIGKEIGKTYSIKLTPEKAFGKRNPQLLKTYSINSFKKNNIDPYPGMTLQLDSMLAKIISVSGGRVIVDFNNPLAGKDVEYSFIVKRKILQEDEKINVLQDYFFRNRYPFTIKNENNNKKVIFNDKVVKLFLDVLGEKFKQMTGLLFEVEEKKEDKVKEEKKK